MTVKRLCLGSTSALLTAADRRGWSLSLSKGLRGLRSHRGSLSSKRAERRSAIQVKWGPPMSTSCSQEWGKKLPKSYSRAHLTTGQATRPCGVGRGLLRETPSQQPSGRLFASSASLLKDLQLGRSAAWLSFPTECSLSQKVQKVSAPKKKKRE